MAAKAKPLPSYTRLCELYTYNAKTGIISRIKPLKGQAVGPLIPTKQYDIHTGRPKYWQLNIDGQKYYYHRVAWKLYTGEDPPDKLDHKNGNIWNNRIRNLRKTTTIKNAYNRGVQKNNKLGVKGVYQRKSRKGYFVRIVVAGTAMYRGPFSTVEKASKIYNKLAVKYHKSHARV